jgi:putative phage-type endonuclease
MAFQMQYKDADEWWKLRSTGIGGSDVAGICGISPFSCPASVYLSKVAPEEKAPEAEKEYQQWGNLLEPVIAKAYEQKVNKRWEKANGIYRSNESLFALASPDGFSVDSSQPKRGIYEAKNVNHFMASEFDPEEKKIPDYYMVQVQWYMYVMSLDWADLSVLIGGNQFRVIENIKRDDVMIRYLLQICKKFWEENVLKRQLPALDGSKASSDLLKIMYPNSSTGAIELSMDGKRYIDDLKALKADMKPLEERKVELENKIKGEMKNADTALYNTMPVCTWKTVKQMRLDTASLKKAHPNIVKKFTTEIHYRRLSINKEGK